jgi:hypothetical protein
MHSSPIIGWKVPDSYWPTQTHVCFAPDTIIWGLPATPQRLQQNPLQGELTQSESLSATPSIKALSSSSERVGSLALAKGDTGQKSHI